MRLSAEEGAGIVAGVTTKRRRVDESTTTTKLEAECKTVDVGFYPRDLALEKSCLF